MIGVRVDDVQRAYPYLFTQKEKIINDELNETPIVIIHTDGARSAMDASQLDQC